MIDSLHPSVVLSLNSVRKYAPEYVFNPPEGFELFELLAYLAGAYARVRAKRSNPFTRGTRSHLAFHQGYESAPEPNHAHLRFLKGTGKDLDGPENPN